MCLDLSCAVSQTILEGAHLHAVQPLGLKAISEGNIKTSCINYRVLSDVRMLALLIISVGCQNTLSTSSVVKTRYLHIRVSKHGICTFQRQ